jgi:hypothetical protein
VPFQPGQSGNPLGRKREKLWKDALTRAMKRLDQGLGDDDPKALERIADRVVGLAMSGDMQAIKEIAERFDGKVAQTTILQGDEDGGPIGITAIEHRIIDPKVIPTFDGEVKVISGG